MTERAVKSELRPVVVPDGGVVVAVRLVERGDRRDRFLRSEYKRQLLADPFARHKPAQVLLDGLDGVRQALLGGLQPIRGSVELGVGLDHLGRHPVLGAEQLKQRRPLLGLALADRGSVAQSEVLHLPDGLEVEAKPLAEVGEVVVDPAAEVPASQTGHLRPSAPESYGRNEGTNLLLSNPDECRLNQRLVGGKFGTVGEPRLE